LGRGRRGRRSKGRGMGSRRKRGFERVEGAHRRRRGGRRRGRRE
jgi:hypothetical protein